MCNPIKTLTKKEWALWLGSLSAVIISNMLSGNVDLLTLAATCIGVTALIFAAKGNVWSQVLMTAFCILFPLLGRNAHLPWNVHAYVDLVDHYMGKKFY